jgi:MoaD family protein
MSRVRVRYFGMLHEITGKRLEEVTVDDSANGRDLIEKLTKLHGRKLRNYLFEPNGKLKDGFAYAINGDSVQQNELAKFKCKDVSEFVVLPPISGG